MISTAKPQNYSLPADHRVVYQLDQRSTHMFRAAGQLLSVEIGQVWVSNGGEDYIVRSGASLRLHPSGDGLVTVSTIRAAFAAYQLKQ